MVTIRNPSDSVIKQLVIRLYQNRFDPMSPRSRVPPSVTERPDALQGGGGRGRHRHQGPGRRVDHRHAGDDPAHEADRRGRHFHGRDRVGGRHSRHPDRARCRAWRTAWPARLPAGAVVSAGVEVRRPARLGPRAAPGRQRVLQQLRPLRREHRRARRLAGRRHRRAAEPGRRAHRHGARAPVARARERQPARHRGPGRARRRQGHGERQPAHLAVHRRHA